MTLTFTLYGPATEDEPQAVALIGPPGATGSDGADGSVWRNGSGAPSNGLGANGDYYLDTATADVYAKSGGTYSIVANIKGLDGIGAGTVTSVGLTAPTGLTVSGSPVTSSGTLALSLTSGYSIPTTTKQGQWDTAYGWGDHSLAGYQAGDADLTALAALSGTDNIYYRSGAATWSSVTVGTGLSFSGGTLAVAGGLGGWVQLATTSSTGAGPWDFTSISSSYEELYVFIDATPSTSLSISVRVSTDNGSTYSASGVSLATVGSAFKGGAYIMGYKNGASVAIAGATTTASPALATGNTGAFINTGGINALRVSLTTGTLTAVTGITLYGR